MPLPDANLELAHTETRALVARIQTGNALPERHGFMRPEKQARSNRCATTATMLDIVGNDKISIAQMNLGSWL
ncbi:MAG: hypothetical protein KGL99_07470 [Burkholderiales bacterium]|nr:hypothetical protein [Burkholderiales bacterium]MDE2626973.1 hypothetical protein [Burkholderiales bacterium]